jgi:hypothetical protein
MLVHRVSIIAVTVVLILCIVFSATIAVAQMPMPYNLFDSEPSLSIVGTVFKDTCAKIGGSITIHSFVENQTFEECIKGNKLFRIATETDCPPQEVDGQGRDPETGKNYTFGWYCEVPRTCYSDYIWYASSQPAKQPNERRYFESKMVVNATYGNITNQYEVITGTRGPVCTVEGFSIENKQISILAKGIMGNVNSMNVTIPSELLSGDYNVMIDGRDVEFERQIISANTTRISVEFHFSEPDSDMIRVDISGTKVIPEFSSLALVVMAGTVAGLIVWTRGTVRKMDY